MGAVGAAALGSLAFRKVRQKIGLEKKDNDDDNASASAAASATSSTGSDSAAKDSAIYDGMLSEDAVAKAKKRKTSGTMADEGSQTFGGGVLGS